MRIGKYEVFNTTTFILPRNDTATFEVTLRAPYGGTFYVSVKWYPDDPEDEVEKGKVGARWKLRPAQDGNTTVDISYVNLNAKFGGAMNQFAEMGKVDGKPFGFMTFFQTYGGESASFTIQFMMEVGDE